MAKGNLKKAATLPAVKDKDHNTILKKNISINDEKVGSPLQWRTQLIKLKPKS